MCIHNDRQFSRRTSWRNTPLRTSSAAMPSTRRNTSRPCCCWSAKAPTRRSPTFTSSTVKPWKWVPCDTARPFSVSASGLTNSSSFLTGRENLWWHRSSSLRFQHQEGARWSQVLNPGKHKPNQVQSHLITDIHLNKCELKIIVAQVLILKQL